MTLPQAWMQQAESDLRAAKRLDNHAAASTRCQAISKYQQCVEKSIKAVLDRLFAARLVGQGSDRLHRVSRYATVLGRFPATPDNRALLNQLNRLFTENVVDQINLLDSLVPAYPAPGAAAARNHEYPFQDVAGDWHAPSDEDAFTVGEMKRIRNCAGLLVPRLRKILEALDLLYP
jgi:hypothetical protein